MSSQAVKIKDLVSKVNIAKGLSRIFNIHLGHIHYTSDKYPYDEKLYERDMRVVNYLIYQHPMKHCWRPIHPSNIKKAQIIDMSSNKIDSSLESN